MKRRPLILILVAVVALAAYFSYRRFVARREPPGQITASGTIEATKMNIAFQVPGRIESILVDEGAVVSRGQPLATLDSPELAVAVRQGEANVAALEARLLALQRGPRPAEIAQARSALEGAAARLVLAEEQWRRSQSLRRNGAISASQADTARAERDSALARRDQARETLRLLQQGTRKEELDAAEAQLEQIQQALLLARSRSDYGTVTAPADAVVLQKNFEVGEVIGAGAPVLTLGQVTKPWLNIYVSEDRIGQVRLGQNANIFIDSFPDRPIPARVSFIAEEAEFTPKNVQTREERVKLVFRVKLTADNPRGILKIGMPADAVIRYDEHATR